MFEVARKLTRHESSAARADELFDQQRDEIYRNTDQLFARLMLFQWLAAILMAVVISPYTWAGQSSAIHIHVWAAIFLGGAISIFPIWLTRAWPGAAITRYVIAVAQMLMSALLISLTGGRIETHFHVFGSLVILSFYRDWRVLIPATIVVGLDHFIRGIYWPYSVYGVLTASPWRSIEHAAWVVFEDIFLVISCLRSISEMRSIANRTAALETTGQVYGAILNSSLDCIITIDHHGRVREFNPAAERVFGFTRAEAVGQELAELIIPPRMRERHRKGMARYLETGEGPVIGQRIEIEALRRDGSEILVELAVTALQADGAPLFTAYLRDITERVRNDRRRVAQYAVANLVNGSWNPEEAAPEILKNVASIGDWALSQLWLLDEDTGTLRLQSAWHQDAQGLEKFAEFSRSMQFKKGIGLPGRVWKSEKPAWISDVIVDSNFPRLRPAIEADLRGGFGFPIFAGSTFIGVIELFSRQVVQPDDDLLDLVAAFGGQIGLFIERKRAEETLREKTRQLESAVHANQLILDHSQDVICTVDQNGHFLSANAACEQLWGYTPNELVGRQYRDLVHPEDRVRTEEAAAFLRATGTIANFTNRYVRKDGSLVDVLWSASWSKADKITFAVAHDITERKRAEEALLKAKDEADRANRAKSDFLSRMSHELRTPLNAILGFGQLLERHKPTEVQKKRIGHIISAGRHLLNLINEILDIARVESGRLQLSLEPVSVEHAVDEAISLVRPLASERKITIERTDLIGSSPSVFADRQRLKQVLLNLLANAVKYNHDAGRVIVDLAPQSNERFRISISDEGPGIPSDKRDRLFSPFDRLGAENSEMVGTGLGLALSKRLVEAMGGAIGESGPATGACFWIEFPLVKGVADRLDSSRVAGTQLITLDGEVKTLLYIEDNLSNLSLIEHLLGECPPIKLISAMQGLLGLELALRHKPDLILLDVHLPDIDGAEVLARLKAKRRTRSIPVVVLSADATKSQIDRLMSIGAADYLTKPLEVDRFLKVIEGHLSESSLASTNGNGT